MPSEPVSDGIFYFWARFLFLPVFPPLPPSLSAPPPTPAAKLSARPPVLPPNLNKEAIGLKSNKTVGWASAHHFHHSHYSHHFRRFPKSHRFSQFPPIKHKQKKEIPACQLRLFRRFAHNIIHFRGYCEVMRLVEVVVGIGGGGLKPTLQFTVSDGIFYFGCVFCSCQSFPCSRRPFPPRRPRLPRSCRCFCSSCC